MQVLTTLTIPDKKSDLKKQTIIWKNYFLICLSMFFFLTAVNTIFGIQSAFYKNWNLSIASSSVILSVYGLSALILPQFFMNQIRFRWTMTLAFVLQLLCIGLIAFPKWYTYIPGNFK